MWEYLWGHTKAQVELLTADAPFVAYKRRNKPKPGEPGYKSDPEKIQRDYEKWLERKKSRKVNLNTFLGEDNTKQDNTKKENDNGTE